MGTIFNVQIYKSSIDSKMILYVRMHLSVLVYNTSLPSEGAATLSIEYEEKLMSPQKAGKFLAIRCDLDLVNVRSC